MSARKAKKPSGAKRKAALIAILCLLALVLAFTGYAALKANVLHVRRAEVAIEDLPPAFDGVSLLYLSDVDLCGVNTPAKAANAMRRLRSLEPDLLILGGDYVSASLSRILNRAPQSDERGTSDMLAATDFFLSLKDFDAPLGKYAVTSPDDRSLNGIFDLIAGTGFLSIDSVRVPVSREGGTLWLTGIPTAETSVSALASQFRRGDCAVAVAWSPEALPQILTCEAADSGPWADMVLCGGTHGGQINLFGRSVLPLTDRETQHLYGWTRQAGIPVLTTSGVGCEGANLRIGSEAEVWLIVLRRGAADIRQAAGVRPASVYG